MARQSDAAGPAARLAALPPRLRTAAACVAAAGVAGAVLGGLAWTRPADVALGGPATTPQEMAFSYAASVPPSPAYDDTTVTEPEPVFRRLADTVDVTYRYDGRGAGTALAVTAELSTPDGWRSTVPLAPTRALDGATEHSGTVVLDLDALERRARDAAAVTGSPPADVRVAVVPRVTTRGGTEFAPALELVLTPLQLRLADPDAAAPDAEAPLTVTGEVETGPGPVTAAQVGLLRWGLDVLPARLLAILLLAAAVVAGLEVRLRARRAAARPEPDRLRDALGPLLVDVAEVEPPSGRAVVDVTDPAVLARVAERYGLLVLHAERGGAARHGAGRVGEHVYVVADGETWYRYTSPGAAPAPPAPPVPRPRPEPSGRLRDELPR